jgi:hypothetical protein
MLSLKWFKGAIERTIEKVVENKMEQAFNELENEEGQTAPSYNPSGKPYLNIKMVNDTLTIVMNDGNIITKAPATSEDFNAARECKTETCLFNLVSTQEVKDARRKAEAEYEKAKAIKMGAEFLAKFNDFEMKDGSLYLKGINRSIPSLMVEEFLEIIGRYSYDGMANVDEMNAMVIEDEEYQALKRFFMWCCLNPRAEVADKLYNFLKKNSFNITKQGFFVALRNVVTLHGSNELVHFVSNAYNKVKAVWKKAPDKYEVYLKNGVYSFIHIDDTYTTELVEGDEWYDEDIEDYVYEEDEEVTVKRSDLGECIGNLTELYLDLPNRAENRFTDAHTRTFDIRIGRPVNMPMEQCRWNTDDCGAEGLHFTSDEIHYVGCGDTSVLVLINPMKVVGIGESKGRCYEYLPIMTVPREEATEILHDLDFDTLELDESYAVRELENLNTKARDGFIAEAKKYEFNLPALSAVEVYTIVRSLDEIKQEISKRIVKID